jgi:hypothetical protein
MFGVMLALILLASIIQAKPSKTTGDQTSKMPSSDSIQDPSAQQRKLNESRAVKRLIEEAISRGVPLYNQGGADACRSVYHIALRAVQLLAPSVHDPSHIDEVLKTAQDEQAQRGAWRLRHLIDEIYQEVDQEVDPEISQEVDPEISQEVNSLVIEFDQTTSWYTLNDNVMGGVSQGGLSISPADQEGQAGVFSGALSLKNNGGFSSTRARIPAGSLSTSQGLEMRIKGDGRTYEALVTTASSPGSWQESFVAPQEWSTVRIPFSKMRLSIRGWSPPLAPAVNPKSITTIGLLIKDKIERPFRLEVDWIRGY